MNPITWLTVPDDSALSVRSGWQRLGKNRYQAVRRHILIVERRDNNTKKGPVIASPSMPADTEFKYEHKQTVVKKFISSITRSIQQTVSTKISTEVSTKLVSEATASATPSLKTQAELQSKISTEFSASLSEQLSGTRTYELTSQEELLRSMTLGKTADDGSGKEATYTFYLPLWVWRWDIYLYEVETLEVTYKRSWLLWQIRETAVPKKVLPLQPLATVMFYEPQDFPSVTKSAYTPEVTDSNEVKVLPLAGRAPVTANKEATALDAFIRLAFPTTKSDRAKSGRASRVLQKSKEDPSENLLKKFEGQYEERHAGKRGGAKGGGYGRKAARKAAKGGRGGTAKGGAKASERAVRKAAKRPAAKKSTGAAKRGTKGGAGSRGTRARGAGGGARTGGGGRGRGGAGGRR